MKKGKPEKKVEVKNFTQTKDIIPDKLLPTLKIREPRLQKPVEPTNPDTLEKNRYVQDPLFEEWPTEEVLATFDFGVTTEKPFKDPTSIPLPPSFENDSSVLVTNKRYKDYLSSFFEKNSVAVSKRSLVKQNTFNLKEMGVDKMSSDSSPLKKLRQSGTVELDSLKLDIGDFQTDDKVDIKICEYSERPETPEEAEERKKREEANAKGKKKPPADKKKPQEEEHATMVKEPQMGFISLLGKKPIFSKWIGSILQVIKDRNIKDVYTGKSILKNIYPQVDGMPVYNPSGRYWVKLYFLGKPRKIEIDDVFPFDGYTFRFLYPMAEYGNILWPLILTKALYKLLSFKWKYQDPNGEVGEGAVMYALTGLLPCTFNLSALKNDWSLFEEALNAFNFFNGRAYLIGYSLQNHKPYIPSNKVDQKSAFKLIARQSMSAVSPMHQSRIILEDQDPFADTSQEVEDYVDSHLQPGFAYSIFDCFTNGKFNMVYVQKIPDWEIKMRREYLEALKETTNRKTRDQILEIKKKRKDLRARIKDEDKKRTDLIMKDPLSYRLFKIMSNVIDQKPLAVICPFNEEEIYTAKKCLVNKLNRPPNYYEFYEDKKDDKSALSSGAPAAANTSNQQMVIENSIASALKPLTDFSKIPNHKEPAERSKNGAWILDSDLLSCFDYVQVYYNPKVYKNLKSEYHAYEKEKINNFKAEGEIIVLEEIKDDDDGLVPQFSKEYPDEENSGAVVQASNKGKTMDFIFSFNPSSFKLVEKFKSYCILEKFDFDNLTSVSSYNTLLGTVDSIKITKPNENSVFRVVTYCPTSYAFTMASNAKFRIMSIPQYLTDYERWQDNTFQIEYKPIEKHKYTVIAKLKIEGQSSGQDIIVRIANDNDRYFKNYTRIRVIKLPSTPGTLAKEIYDEGVYMNKNEMTLAGKEYHRFHHKAGERYLAMIDFLGEYNAPEGTLKVSVLSKQEAKVTNLDITDTLEFADKYVPYKYGIIFRERLFSHNPEVYATFRVNLLKMATTTPGTNEDPSKQVAAPPNPKDKKPATKPPAGGAAQATPAVDLDQAKELDSKKLLYLELFEEDTLKQVVSGFNEATLFNAILKGDKAQQTNFYLQARFELREVPEAASANEFTQGLYWNLSVSANDTIVVAKDTQKEEKEKALIDSWESKEPGRKDKARSSRHIFELRKKKLAGGTLTEEELKLITESKADKYAPEDPSKKAGAAPGKPGAKAPAPPPAKKPAAAPPGKKDPKEVAKEEETKKEIVFPKSTDHNMVEVKAFLKHMENPRMNIIKLQENAKPRVRDQREFDEIFETCLMNREDVLSHIDRSNKRREDLKKQREHVYEERVKQFNEEMEVIKKKYEELKEQMTSLNSEGQKKRENEGALLAALAVEPLQEAPLKEAIRKAKEQKVDERLIYVAEKYLKNTVIKNVAVNLKEKLEAYDENGVKQLKEFIEQNNIEIDEDLQLQMEEFFLNIEANPNYIQEKLAELKKLPKGKKK